ncbi:MAG: MerR family DNA-binding transcriptional regulator [Candidatus Taylorbacteria bacterium CG10_big_fil_rev_8_21_14_0_10_41_48]|uniref:MerR family DNA-binding transcriptional regulator n=1 Tax=Candidatus Taylorbacteria bacterium CG10_big_fil_rev_8_21_14_0_10_41_48 TaxID=1975024 RepID=A0A2M8LBW9_9BACT|nr:MAG: MerR family DNA-binding transcriptional regulator [Candidatus Taylorbacteria bacterium CG10_big_fil_rev_8_21_14_0_10_41_48]
MSGKFLTIKEAAEYLGVTPLTLRNWDRSGKLPTTRHPMSNYRIYKSEDLEKLVRDIDTGSVPMKAKKRKLAKRKLMVRSIKD